MKLIVCYKSQQYKELINQTKILDFIKNQMEGQTFQELMNNFNLKKKDN